MNNTRTTKTALYLTLTLLLFITTVFMAGCNGSNGGSASETISPSPTVSPVQPVENVVSIAVLPQEPSIPLGLTQQFTAVGTYPDGSSADITNYVVWSVSEPGIATIDEKGLVTASEDLPGVVTVTAVLNTDTASEKEELSASTTLKVTNPVLSEIVVTPDSPTIPRGQVTQFVATGKYNDGTSYNISSMVTWSSSDNTVASISNSPGYNGSLNPLSKGTTNVIATFKKISSTADVVTVTDAALTSITIDQVNPSLTVGSTLNFTATGHYTDGIVVHPLGGVTWNSSDPAKASVDTSSGLASGLTLGTTNVTAALGTVKSSPSTLTVSSSGMVTLTSITISPSSPSIHLGYNSQFSAIGVYSDGSNRNITDEVTWHSGTPAVAVFSVNPREEGMASSLTTGTTDVYASKDTVDSNHTTLTVTGATLESITIDQVNPSLALGTGMTFTARGHYSDGSEISPLVGVTWNSSNTGTATINPSTGLINTVAPGTTNVTATLSTVTSSVSTLTVTGAVLQTIEVTPAGVSVPLGVDQQFVATGVFSDSSRQNLTDQVTWNSSDIGAVQFSGVAGEEGLAISVAAGSSNVTAQKGGIASNTVNMTVTAATLESITIDQVNPSLGIGGTMTFTATGRYSDGSTVSPLAGVTWNSSNVGTAAIDPSTGVVATVQLGNTNVTATSGSVTSNVSTLSVTSAILSSIDVTPAGPLSLARGIDQQFAATGHYSDGTTRNITDEVTWISSNTSAVEFSGVPGEEGMAISKAVGTTNVTAQRGAVISNTTVFNVTAKELVSITLSPSSGSILVAETISFTAVGHYTDGSTDDPLAGVTWNSNPNSVATITSGGVATGVTEGSTNITATLGTVTSSPAPLTVVGTTLDETEDFNMWPLAGWTIIDNLGGTYVWSYNNNPSFMNKSYTAVNPNATQGSGTGALASTWEWTNSTQPVNTTMISPSYNLSGKTSAAISYKYYFYVLEDSTYSGIETARVDVSVNGGSSWTTIKTYPSGTVTGSGTEIVDVSAYVGNSNVQFRFVYQTTATTSDFDWMVDDFNITAN